MGQQPLSSHSASQHTRYNKMLPYLWIYASLLALTGFLLDTPEHILAGLKAIILTEDALITDYVMVAGPGAALVNSALVTAISLCVLWFSRDVLNGMTLVVIGLMSGFSLFGKNFVNIWPILLGSWLYAKYRKEPYASFVNIGLMSTALAPVISYIALDNGWGTPLSGSLIGLVIGFILPPLAAYTYRIQNGMNLYNVGFACGLVAFICVPLMSSLGADPTTQYRWAHGCNGIFLPMLVILCLILILSSLFLCRLPLWAAWAGYRRLLQTSGRAPSDYLRMFGAGPVMVNIGCNGILGILFVLLIGGDLNGPTIGGIFTIMGFSAFGKHPFNIIPVMAGVSLGAYGMHYSPNYPSLQLAGLFGTTLAPIAGHFGWPFGILAGFIHSALVLQTGGPVAGLNLYNNGFSGGLIAIVLYPTITAIWKHRRPTLRDEDYYDLFEDSAPIDTSFWRTSRKESTPHSTHEMRPASDRDGPNSRMTDDEPEESELP